MTTNTEIDIENQATRLKQIKPLENHLLAALPAEVLKRLLPDLKPVAR